MDEARRNNIEIDSRGLSKELGIPVVETSARSRTGMEELLKYIHQVATSEYICKPRRIRGFSKKIKKTIDELTEKIKQIYPDLPNAGWVALRLLEGDQTIIDSVKRGELAELVSNPSNELSNVI